MKSAEQNIILYLQQNKGGWYNAAHLQRMIFKNKNGTDASPKSISRRLQENAEGENAVLEVKTENGQAWYKAKEDKVPTRKEFAGYVERDGHRYATFKEVAVV